MVLTEEKPVGGILARGLRGIRVMHENSPKVRKLHAEERNAGPAPLSGGRRPWAEARKFLRSCGLEAWDPTASLRWSEAAPGAWVWVRVKKRGVVAYRWLRWSRTFHIAIPDGVRTDPPSMTTPSPSPGKVAG